MQQRNHIQILANDTDMFVILIFFIGQYKSQAQVSMKWFSGEIIDIL